MEGRGEGWRGAVEKEAVSYQSKEDPECSPKYQRKKGMWVWWERGVTSSERTSWVHLCPTSHQHSESGNLMTLFIFTLTGDHLVSSSHFHPFVRPGQ